MCNKIKHNFAVNVVNVKQRDLSSLCHEGVSCCFVSGCCSCFLQHCLIVAFKEPSLGVIEKVKQHISECRRLLCSNVKMRKKLKNNNHLCTDLIENSSDNSQKHNSSYSTTNYLLKWEFLLIQLHLGINLHTVAITSQSGK